jgi:hypothetical protein
MATEERRMEWEPVASRPRKAQAVPGRWGEPALLMLAALWLVLAAVSIVLSR